MNQSVSHLLPVATGKLSLVSRMDPGYEARAPRLVHFFHQSQRSSPVEHSGREARVALRELGSVIMTRGGDDLLGERRDCFCCSSGLRVEPLAYPGDGGVQLLLARER